MSSLRLTLRTTSEGRLDLSGVVPDRLLPLSLAEIAQLPVAVQGRGCALGDHFDIEEGARDKLILSGDLGCADFVGGGMREGMLVVEGSVGHCLAANMRRGHIVIQGNAGDYVGSGQRGGYVNIEGNVQDYCGASLPGERSGMRGGTLRVAGSAGRFLGQRMRRGTIIVVGDVGAGCGSSLIAGTIVCCASLAPPVGFGMRRGTIVCLSSSPPPLHVGFTVPEQIHLTYLYLLFDALRPQLANLPVDALARQPMWRSLGDRASAGMGEVLWLA
jgi:formylmethanofuran dehydrogenase subunit C